MKKFLMTAVFPLLLCSVSLAQMPGGAGGIVVSEVEGTVYYTVNGVRSILTPGTVVPQGAKFEVVDGSVSLTVNGHTITGTTGSNFNVSMGNGSLIVESNQGVPVEITTSGGHSIILTSQAMVKLTGTSGGLDIEVLKNKALVSDPATGKTVILDASKNKTLNISYGGTEGGDTSGNEGDDTADDDTADDDDSDVQTDPTVTVENPTQELEETPVVISPSAP